MHRVVSNEALKHLQWIVVEDRPDGPVMVRGPFAEEHVAQMHCDALNNKRATKRAVAGIRVIWPLIRAGWFGIYDGVWVPNTARRLQ